ncbi:symmetrical bis(5'-nucleosyl)-tetraphosphatase [Ningiella sp. W23]|uniref:symmetrical bis(5'-nucleosyl)-tetraphosphatase n=1 Tax=Ningiella sp. W23 TaxID=3023715 RepID=UPI003756F12B
MKNYVVGDIQGCYRALKKALKQVKFNPKHDKLWAVGDLVARGPDSLETLQFCRDLGEQFETVLGNHDLHLIAIAHGIRSVKPQDKLESLIQHKHFDALIDWLMQKPLAIKPAKKTLISHAGLYPSWSIKTALKLSNEVQAKLQGKQPEAFLRQMYGNSPTKWDDTLMGYERLRFVVNAFTRMRYLSQDMDLDFAIKCHPNDAPKRVKPWFDMPNTALNEKHLILFGHWASLMGEIPPHIANHARIRALDTGFVWGNSLSLYCIETQETFQLQA